MDKKVYIQPTLKVVSFHVETGFASSPMGSSLEGFLGELYGHESFVDNTGDFSESDYWNF